jgi:hypothetical protein
VYTEIKGDWFHAKKRSIIEWGLNEYRC